MIIKATTTNPATRFCTMAATPGERMRKATGANRGDLRRGSAPLSSRPWRGHAAKESTIVDLMAVQTCAALRKFDARSEAASWKFACLAAIAAMALSGRAAERDLDDLLLVRLPAPPEGRRAPLQVMGGNYPRRSGVCPWWNAMVAR